MGRNLSDSPAKELPCPQISTICCQVSRDKVRLPKRSDKGRYDDQTLRGVKFVAERY
jgi:hypothetical protein